METVERLMREIRGRVSGLSEEDQVAVTTAPLWRLAERLESEEMKNTGGQKDESNKG